MYEHKQKYKGCAVHPKIWDAYLFNVANAYFKFWWKLGPTLYEYYYVNEDTTTYLSDQIKLQNNFAPMVAGISDQINKSINNQENIEAVIDNRTDMDSSSDINNKEDSNQAKVTFQQIEMLLDRLKQNDPAKYDGKLINLIFWSF